MEVDENVAATSSQSEKQEPTTLVCHLSQIVAEETDEESLLEGEKETCSGYSRPLSQLLDGLFHQVVACGDRLVMLAPQLIKNLTSNMAKCYMGLRTICDGGK